MILIYVPFFSANDAAYIFLGARYFATQGSFDENALLISGQKVNYHISGCNVNGLPKLEFSEPVKPDIHYHYLPGKKDNFGDQPIIIDEIAEEYIEVRKISDYEVPAYLSLSSIIQVLFKHT
jgi:hypothetical protein